MVLVIAEAGVNHNGDIELAKKLIDAAVEAGADIVKFQTFKASKLASDDAKQADYQSKNMGKEESQVDMLSRLELSYQDFVLLERYCANKNITFLSTAFDEESLDFLVKEIGQKYLKVSSGDLTNAPFLLAHAKTGLDIIISTGMSSLGEIEDALGVLAFGYLEQNGVPTKEAFAAAYHSSEGHNILREKVTILHCTTEYPAPLEEINLKAMDTLETAFGLNTGYSDHSEGVVVPLAAAARSAKIIEKHFTLSRDMEGPDHKASLEPHELSDMIAGIRSIEIALGNGIKGPTPSELKNLNVARKSLVAAVDIEKGDVFTSENIEIKRPGDGLSPMNYWGVLGQISTKSYKTGALISE